MKAMRSFLENAPSEEKIQCVNTRFFMCWGRLMKIDTALHLNKKTKSVFMLIRCFQIHAQFNPLMVIRIYMRSHTKWNS